MPSGATTIGKSNVQAKALIIALAIYGPASVLGVEKSERLYDAIELTLGWSDDMKAELYAHLEEALTATTGLAQAEKIILNAMEKVCQ